MLSGIALNMDLHDIVLLAHILNNRNKHVPWLGQA